MTSRKPFSRSAVRLIAIAGFAGIVAGALAVYVTSRGAGNGDGITYVARTAPACEAAAAKTRVVSEFSRGQVAAMVPAQPPRPIDLAFKGPAGENLTLSGDFAGKTVLVNLWAIWCVPCREEMPALNALQAQVGAQAGLADFEVVAINIDTGGDEKPKAFLAEYGIDDLAYYRDASMGVFTALKREGLVFGLPATLLLDEKGCLLASMNGPAVWDGDDAKALIAAAKR